MPDTLTEKVDRLRSFVKGKTKMTAEQDTEFEKLLQEYLESLVCAGTPQAMDRLPMRMRRDIVAQLDRSRTPRKPSRQLASDDQDAREGFNELFPGANKTGTGPSWAS